MVGPVMLMALMCPVGLFGLAVSAKYITPVDRFGSVRLVVYMCLVGLFGFDVSAKCTPLVDLVGPVMMIASVYLVGSLVLVVLSRLSTSRRSVWLSR